MFFTLALLLVFARPISQISYAKKKKEKSVFVNEQGFQCVANPGKSKSKLVVVVQMCYCSSVGRKEDGR